MSYLISCEVSKKQDYIFRSNRLSENIGASYIVKHVTEELPLNYLGINNGRKIFEGGGKNLYIFEDKTGARQFTKTYSKYVLEKYSGIELFITGVDFDFEKEDIIDKIDELNKKLEIKKSQRKYNTALLSLGVTEVCHSTGLPAYKKVSNGSKNSPVSREIYIKLEESNKANDAFKDLKPEGFEFPKDFDDLGRSINEKSYIGVVHIDGNKMGKKMEGLKIKYARKQNESIKEHNQRYLDKIYEFSNGIKNAYSNAFKKMVESLVKNHEALMEKLDISQNILPLRPLILAGDDVCFVCDARIAIQCSKIFIESLISYPFKEGQLHACAGIAMVKSHYPFARAYKLAEELCENAKGEIKDEDASLIDWHISQGDIDGSIFEIRNKYYKSNDGVCALNMRPLFIDENKSWRNTSNLKNAVRDITKEGVPRSKVKELREIFKQGRDRTQIFIQTSGKDIQNIIHRFKDSNGKYGFTDDNICMYYDAVEIMDIYVDILEG